VGCADGVLRILDRKLRVREEILLRSPPLVHAVADVDRDGKAEVLATTDDGRLVVADCSPGYPAPGVSELFLAPAEVQKQFPGRVLADRFSADLEPGIVTWFRSEADSFGALTLLHASPAEFAQTAGQARRLTASQPPVLAHAWDLPGQRLAFVTKTRGDSRVQVVVPDGSPPRELFRGKSVASLCWGDGDRLAFRAAATSATWRLGLGRLVVMDASTGERAEVPGAEFGPPVWQPRAKRWVAVRRREGRWSVAAVTRAGQVEALMPERQAPLGARVAVLPESDLVFFSELEEYRRDQPDWAKQDGPFLRTQLCSWDPETQEQHALLTVDRIERALRTGRQGVEPAVLRLWFQPDQFCLPGMAPAEPAAPGRAPAPQSPQCAVSADGLLAFPLGLARAHLGNWIGASPHDLWTWSQARGELQRLTRNDDTEEGSPAWSPGGRWLAYEALRTDLEKPRSEVWLAVKGRLGGTRLALGRSPAWRPGAGSKRELTYLREGAVWAVSVIEAAAQSPPFHQRPVFPYFVGSLLGVGVMIVGFRLRLGARLRWLVWSVRFAMQTLQRDRQFVLLRELVTIVDQAESGLHSLKNTVLLLPALGDDRDQLEESLGYILNPENVNAACQYVELVLRTIDRLSSWHPGVSDTLDMLPVPVQNAYGAAVYALVQNRGALAMTKQQLLRLLSRYGGRGALPAADRTALAADASEQVQSLYSRLTDEAGGGLFDIVKAASAPLRVSALVQAAVERVSARAAEMGVSLSLDGTPLPARFLGDPERLTQVLTDLLGNALDALSARAAAVSPAVRVSLTAADGTVAIAVADNGVGLEAAAIGRLAGGHQVSTKGRGRGVGLSAARRMLSRYPGGSLSITSPGSGRGCTVIVSFDEL